MAKPKIKKDIIEEFGYSSNGMVVRNGTEVQIRVPAEPYNDSVEKYCERLLELTKDLSDCIVDNIQDDYDSGYTVHVIGWRPMNNTDLRYYQKLKREKDEKELVWKERREQNEMEIYERIKKQIEG